MGGCTRFRFATFVLCLSASLLAPCGARAASKAVDLDGNPANGAESQCDLNVLQTFPVMIENKVTNRSGGDSFAFAWPSAGPGGFSSSVTPGTTGGVGAKWVWTTNQSVYSYTGSSCANDVCFTQTGGPDNLAGYCNDACLVDPTSITVAKGATAGTVVLTWTGGDGPFTIFRSTNRVGLAVEANAIGTSTALTFTDTPTDALVFYSVRGVCTSRKACASAADCSAPGDGICVSRGPFGVPGRSLFSNAVTVSASSLTSSLITFFSPPKEVFRVTSTAAPGGVSQILNNNGTAPVTVTTPAYPPGCCPANPDVPHQLRCGDTCVDYLNDVNNCGGCGVVCGDGTCCSNGSCASLCAPGHEWCDGECADVQNDSNNCGGCGVICGDGTCCNEGSCASLCPEGQVWCDNQCVDLQNDSSSCGTCGTACLSGTCCDGGSCASICAPGQAWCGTDCADLQNDSANCGACGNACGEGSCCNAGVCEPFCTAPAVQCGDTCADLQNDSANCGACGNACAAGSCCNAGVCESFCPSGQVLCGTMCVDFQNDSANCGACNNACGAGSCCNAGVCESFCPSGQVLCGTMCVDFQNDNANCGACDNACGGGTCCSQGACESLCPSGQVWCDGQCVDLQNDSSSCGTCGHACGDGTCCNAGACVSTCPAGRTLCDGECVDLQSDDHNCGSCGHSCGHNTLSGHDSHCEHGVCGGGTLTDPSSTPPIPPSCPNPHPTYPQPGHCENLTPTYPTPGYCHNLNPTSPTPGSCQNPNPSSATPAYCHNLTPSNPVPGVCPNLSPSTPHAGVCPNVHPSPGPVAGVCPEPSGPPASGSDTATCTIPETTTTIAPGGSATTCTPGGGLFKEVPTEITVCGDGIPGAQGQCNNTTTKITTGTFNRLVPDPSQPVGDAFVTPYFVHVVGDTSNDGLIEPGETASLIIDTVNAGPMNITNATAMLSAPAVDLSDDGVNNPVGLTIGTGAVSYGTILGTPAAVNCTTTPPQPASNTPVFQITVPPDHPGDTSHPLNLTVNGTVNGGPFTMTVPVVLGIADKCDYTAHNRDYDGLDGLANPMSKLVPTGETVPMAGPFTAGNTRPLKLRVLCGTANLTDADVDAPEIIGLSEATRGDLDIHALNLNSDNTNNPNDPFFRFNNSLSGGQWSYSMRTALIGTGTFTLKIRIAGRKEYVTGFVLR
jgi:hypothetical protein